MALALGVIFIYGLPLQDFEFKSYKHLRKYFFFGNYYCDSKLALQTQDSGHLHCDITLKVLFYQKADGRKGIRLSRFNKLFPPFSAI